MKKLAGMILAATFVFTLGSTSVFAASENPDDNRIAGAAACQFVDENKDGICDVHGEDCLYIDENNDGICDNFSNGGARPRNGAGRRAGQGRFGGFYVDSDGNGVCDNFGSNLCGRR